MRADLLGKGLGFSGRLENGHLEKEIGVISKMEFLLCDFETDAGSFENMVFGKERSKFCYAYQRRVSTTCKSYVSPPI